MKKTSLLFFVQVSYMLTQIAISVTLKLVRNQFAKVAVKIRVVRVVRHVVSRIDSVFVSVIHYDMYACQQQLFILHRKMYTAQLVQVDLPLNKLHSEIMQWSR